MYIIWKLSSSQRDKDPALYATSTIHSHPHSLVLLVAALCITSAAFNIFLILVISSKVCVANLIRFATLPLTVAKDLE